MKESSNVLFFRNLHNFALSSELDEQMKSDSLEEILIKNIKTKCCWTQHIEVIYIYLFIYICHILEGIPQTTNNLVWAYFTGCI